MQTELLPSWNLDDLFSGMDDPGIEETLKRELLRAKEFAAEFKGRINSPSLTAEQLLCAVKTYENIAQESDKPLEYASLLFAADTSIPERGAFMQRMQERTSEIAIELIFFELELLALPEDQVKRLLLDPVLSGYSHYIKAARLFSPHRLTEPEEKILEETANTGRRAFTRLFEETVSNAAFSVDIKGEIKEMNLQSLLALQREPDRDVRKASAESLTKGLLANARTLTFIFNTLLQDKATIDRLRRYTYPEESRHLSNELDRETVELVVGTAVDYYPIVRRYYNLKRKILGYDGLCHYDRYAPLFELKERVPFSHAKEIVLDSFHKFSPEMSDAAGKFFEGRWIDAEVRPGKRGGAFCSYATPDLHPYVLVNYLHRTDDVMTLAHELGHGVHAYVARDKSYLNFSSVLPVAELASTFGEMLVFESLQKEAGREEKLALYAEKIEGAFATIFRQAAMYRFEQGIHERRRSAGELTTEDFSAIWQSRQQEMFGSSLTLGDEHRFWWMYVSHFTNSPFYVYAYTFGELLVMALYAMYKKEGAPFAEKYVSMLKTGGSLSPADMLSTVGIDVHDPKFWQGGLEFLSGFIGEFEMLCNS